jgi:hypothetical protein
MMTTTSRHHLSRALLDGTTAGGQTMIPTTHLSNNCRLGGGSTMLLDHKQHGKATTMCHRAQSLTSFAGTLTNTNLLNAPKCVLLPMSHRLFDGLNDYIIVQKNIKITLSIGVHNHYKRILVKESQDGAMHVMQVESLQQEQYAKQMHMQMQQHHAMTVCREGHLGFNPDNNGINGGGYDKGSPSYWEPTIADLWMDQFGWSTTPPFAQLCKTPGIPNNIGGGHHCDHSSRSIAALNHNIGLEVEDCKLDKSNIIIIGPTGSSKTSLSPSENPPEHLRGETSSNPSGGLSLNQNPNPLGGPSLNPSSNPSSEHPSEHPNSNLMEGSSRGPSSNPLGGPSLNQSSNLLEQASGYPSSNLTGGLSGNSSSNLWGGGEPAEPKSKSVRAT